MLLSVALMLRWSLGRPDLAVKLEAAVNAVMAAGYLTPDLAPTPGASVGTDDVVAAVIRTLHENGGSHDRGHLRHHVA
jgi:3-isopropylmalate dehydrogenase